MNSQRWHAVFKPSLSDGQLRLFDLTLSSVNSVICFPLRVTVAWELVPDASRQGISWDSSVQFSCSVVSDSLRPHGLQHARPPCPSPTPKACSNSCPSNRWCHPAISSSVVPFSSSLQSFRASGSFLMSQFFASGGQSIGATASASVLPMSIQVLFPLGLTGLNSLLSKGLSRVFSSTAVQRHQFLALSLLYGPTLTSIHDY